MCMVFFVTAVYLPAASHTEQSVRAAPVIPLAVVLGVPEHLPTPERKNKNRKGI